MQKDEILAKSRKENKNKDMAELEVINQAGRIATIVGTLLCCVISFLEWNLAKRVNWGCWTINFGILSTMFLFKYIKLRKKHELVLSVLYILFMAFFGYGYVFSLVGNT